MNIDIIAVGKIKENYLQEGIREYKKRLMHICRLNIIEVHEEKSPEGLSEAQKLQLLEKEGSYILKKLDAESFTVALCIEGAFLRNKWQRGCKESCFRANPHYLYNRALWGFLIK